MGILYQNILDCKLYKKYTNHPNSRGLVKTRSACQEFLEQVGPHLPMSGTHARLSAALQPSDSRLRGGRGAHGPRHMAGLGNAAPQDRECPHRPEGMATSGKVSTASEAAEEMSHRPSV